MAGEEGPDAGAFAVDSNQSPGVGQTVDRAAPILLGHRHAEHVVLLRELSDRGIRLVLEIGDLLDRADFLAIRLDVGDELRALFGGRGRRVG